MGVLFILFICFSFLSPSLLISSEIGNVKKITVLESNNERLDDRFQTLIIPSSLQDSTTLALRKFVSTSLSIKDLNDPEVFIKVMEWVSTRWKHNSFNEPPQNASSLDILMMAQKGTEFRCLEYGKVVSDVLLSYGYISRIIGMNSKDIAYGSLGMGHAASEVWSNTFQKWIFIDPQFCVYAKYHGEYLNYYDMYLLRKQGKFKQIEFVISDAFLKNNGLKKQEVIAQYRKFLDPYFGYLMCNYTRSGNVSLISLSLEATDQFITSQGLTARSVVFTQNPRDMYYSLNRTLVIFNYKELSPNLQQILSDFKIQNNDDYMKNMHLFAAKPDFTLNLQNNMPWFDHYEYKFDEGEWTTLYKDEIEWKILDGNVKTLYARSINKAGIAGYPTKIKVAYK
ncbi:MAG: hypothetical protein HYZ54_10765 [Ignavibacteriae bacterium]|nr:hypothetical protein [Ignavibacteriota bacterium]